MAGVIAVNPRWTFFDSAGNPITNGLVHTWQANAIGSVPLTTWLNKSQGAANANPIELDSDGSAIIWLDPDQVYDFVVKDSTDTITYQTIEDISGANSGGAVTSTEWFVTGLVATYVSSTVFTVPGDQTSVFKPGRAVKTTEGVGVNKYGVVVSSVFSSVTSVVLSMESTPLSPSLTTVDVGQLSPDHPSGLYGIGNRIFMTGYSGSDIVMQPGQYAIYSVSAVTSLLLRIATGNNQEYEIYGRGVFVAGAAAGAVTTLQPNNANTAAAAVSIESSFGNQAVANASIVPSNVFQLDAGFTQNWFNALCYTGPNGKFVESRFRNTSNVANYYGGQGMTWNDTATAWSSLGTLNFGNAFTGRITVKRIY